MHIVVIVTVVIDCGDDDVVVIDVVVIVDVTSMVVDAQCDYMVVDASGVVSCECC